MATRENELALHTALDIATTFTYGADRVQMHVVDESTVLALGFKASGASGRVAWITRFRGPTGTVDGGWVYERRLLGHGRPKLVCDPNPGSLDDLETHEDLKALVVWLRGEA